MSVYELRGGDDAAYGPSFGPLRGKPLFAAKVIETGVPCLVLACDVPLQAGGQCFRNIALTMRYTGEQLEELRSREAIVAVYGLPSDAPDSWRDGVCSRNMISIAVGHCCPLAV